MLLAELQRANQGLTERVAELETRLGQSPLNSSKPPSSEGFAPPRQSPGNTPSANRPPPKPAEQLLNDY
ncbi:DUF6444 domain-containing protein [Arthrobacter oryzae]|uniref:DUF6444 domain-containing protein n=1 Tax=Arthrobacter oryzae TaxID=409290 RepID=A0A3N0CE86_9MICC|nr:DUF6444 domain-containing protein [Arthrobacter oryzae]RNL61738.1 hypothetical protein D7003_01065 [Arthrobacter oryzae]